ncbi:MAG TPA: hypothetical protein DCZ75_09250 [Geobacter sp.]|nr:hypothetical protein [Geobacter sp.]
MWRLSPVSKRSFLVAIGMLVYLVNPLLAGAECSLSFLPIEESKYLLKGEGFDGVAALTFTVDYDTAYLFAPDVTVMGGNLLEQDRGASAPPGKLRLHILNQDRNAAFEATIFFQKRGDYPPVINFVTAEATDPSGAVSPVPVQMAAPVNLPQEEVPAATSPPNDAPPSSQEEAAELLRRELGVPRTESAPPAAPQKTKAVFERFRDFSGGKSLAAFRELFADVDVCCRQTPSIVIADGKRTARVAISGVEAGDGPPAFTVRGGMLVSAQRGSDGEEWIVVVQPFENWWDVSLSATFANAVVDFPLTVTPAIGIPRGKLAQIKEKSYMLRLQSFLAGKPGKALSKYPLWLREYLYTANYLAAREGAGK